MFGVVGGAKRSVHPNPAFGRFGNQIAAINRGVWLRDRDWRNDDRELCLVDDTRYVEATGRYHEGALLQEVEGRVLPGQR